MTKEKIVKIVCKMGFYLDYDQWDEKGWMRFELNRQDLDEKDLRLIWYKDVADEENFAEAADILFRAGQKHKAQVINKLDSL
jgi:hypothetical protein